MARISLRAFRFVSSRLFSTSSFHAPPNSLYARVRNFVINNPALCDPGVTSLAKEPVSSISKIQEELLEQLEECDINYDEFKTREGSYTTKDKPNLVPFDEERRTVGCICYEESHHISYLLLYKGIPARCKCGHWFKLVDFTEYESARDRYWNKVKNKPENAKLAKDLDDSESELRKLLDESKTMTEKSYGATEMLDQLSIQWAKYKEAYSQIRKNIDEACITDIR